MNLQRNVKLYKQKQKEEKIRTQWNKLEMGKKNEKKNAWKLKQISKYFLNGF